MTFVTAYEKVSPAVLEMEVLAVTEVLVNWTEIDEDRFSFRVYGDPAQIEKVIPILAAHAS